MLDVARDASSPAATLVQGDALALPFPDASFDRVVSGHFYGHLDEYAAVDVPARGRRVARELVARRRVARALGGRRAVGAARPRATARAGRSTSAGSRPSELLAELGRRRRAASPATGSSSSAHRGERAPARSPPTSAATAAAACASRRGSRSTRGPSSPVTPASARTSSGSLRAGSRRRPAGPGRVAPGGRSVAGSQLDEEEFFARFYCASVTRCYPGRAGAGAATAAPRPRRGPLRAVARDASCACSSLGWSSRSALVAGPSGCSASVGSPTPWARASSLGERGRDPAPPSRPGRAAGSTTRTNRARLGKALTHVRRELAAL